MELKERLEIEGLKVASITKRAVAMAIDDFLISLLVIIAFFDSFSNAKTYEELMRLTDSLFLYILAAYTLYHWIFVAIYGKTIGKMIVKIKIIDAQTFDKPTFLKAFIRSAVRNFDEMFFYLGMLYALTNPLTQTIHDKISKVVVIDD